MISYENIENMLKWLGHLGDTFSINLHGFLWRVKMCGMGCLNWLFEKFLKMSFGNHCKIDWFDEIVLYKLAIAFQCDKT